MCHKTFLHLLVLNFPPLIVTTNPSGGDTGLLQTVVAEDVYSAPGRDTVADGGAGASRAGIVSAIGEALQNPIGDALQILTC